MFRKAVKGNDLRSAVLNFHAKTDGFFHQAVSTFRLKKRLSQNRLRDNSYHLRCLVSDLILTNGMIGIVSARNVLDNEY